MTSAAGKRIHKIKLAVTTACNLKCRYCFVKKTGESMSSQTARRAVDLLIRSQGRRKQLAIYGGEPLMRFALVKNIVAYAAAQARRTKKDLVTSLCTNGTLLTAEQSRFFNQHGVKLVISHMGRPAAQDGFRRFAAARGSHGTISKNLESAREKLGPYNLGAALCVAPATAKDMRVNFEFLAGLGFSCINIEVIRHFQVWGGLETRQFLSNFDEIRRLLLAGIKNGSFMFLNPVNRELAGRLLSRRPRCMFRHRIEVYPKGDMAFSPFLLNSPDKAACLIGNVNRNFIKRYLRCRYGSKDAQCRDCENAYFSGRGDDAAAANVHAWYHKKSLELAYIIRKKAISDRRFREYIAAIKKRKLWF